MYFSLHQSTTEGLSKMVVQVTFLKTAGKINEFRFKNKTSEHLWLKEIHFFC
jgi:hypothetical protein